MDIEAFAAENGTGTEDIPDLLSQRAIDAYKRYMQTGSSNDINEAILWAKQGIDLANDNNLLLTQWLNYLGVFLESQYERTGEMTDIEEAIQAARKAIELTPTDHPDRPGWFNNLGTKLETRYERTGEIKDLEEAIEIVREAIGLMSSDHPDLAVILNNLGNKLGLQYERTGEIRDLEEAIQTARRAVELTPKDHPDLAGWLNDLGVFLSRRYERTGKTDDLEEAIEIARRAAKSTPDGHPDLAVMLNNLGNKLGLRYERTGEIRDLEEAIQTARQAVASTPGNHPNLAVMLNNLGNKLEKRQQTLGDEHPDTISTMSNLAAALDDQGKLDEAASMKREVLEKMQQILGDGHPHTIMAMNNLAITLGDQGKLDEAESMKREVLEKMQRILGDGHPYTIMAMNNLAITLGDQGKLDEAASMKKEVFEKMQKTLGNKHPHTTRTAECLRHVPFALSAVQLLQHVVAIREKALAEDHPSRLASQHKLAGAYRADNQGRVSIKHNRVELKKGNRPRHRVAAAYVQTEFADADEISAPLNSPTSGVSPDVRQLFDKVAFSSLFNDGVRIVRFIHGKPGAQETFFNRFKIGLEQRIGQRIDWSPFPPVSRPCLPNESRVVWNWGGKELSVILAREEACQYYATCRPVFQSSNNQSLPFTNLDCNPDTKATPALGTRAIHNSQGAADVINRPDPTIQTYLTAELMTPQNSQETEIYWCIDKIFNEPIKTVFRCIDRADRIREDSSFYRQVNHKLRSAEGTGLKGWITPYISWKRVTAVEFIKFLRVRGDWVIRDKAELPRSDDYEHNVGTPEGARMMILAEEIIAGLHDPKGAEVGNYMVNALPKRRCPPPLPIARGTEAWSLHAKMGFSAGRIVWWFTSSIIFSVVFATVWLATVDKTDVQTALTPGTAIAAVLTLILGILQTLNQ